MVVALNRGTVIWTPKYYNPYWCLRFRCGVNIRPAEVVKGPVCLVRRIINKYTGLGFRVWGLGLQGTSAGILIECMRSRKCFG